MQDLRVVFYDDQDHRIADYYGSSRTVQSRLDVPPDGAKMAEVLQFDYSTSRWARAEPLIHLNR